MIETFIVTENTGRLDKVIADALPDYSRSQVKDWIDHELVTVNGMVKKAKYQAKTGEEIVVTIPAPVEVDIQPEDIPLDIVYEDADLLVVNKPQGMVVHPAAGHESGTLVNALMFHTPLSTINGEFRPGIVHRIDKDTSGLLMVAKNDKAHEALSAQLKEKKNLRLYYALVHGEFKENEGTIKAPIGRSNADRKKQAVIKGGRDAVTHFKVMKRYVGYTLLEVRLETGRTHQIRVHMAYIGHPVAGDPLYGPKKSVSATGQYLHAATLGLTQPTTGEDLTFEAPLPANFEKFLSELEPYAEIEK
ncbi:RluA family pseudouridine synthase [Weissella soli]|uniref:Pseudouridine synthase n=1 Tax=Weissella soli TaxID=155866 RepID=A0A288QWA5_9LACO|nr:RluA family pseudouridine synthase [Weissella soli]AOT56091.1 23S rRNA pseudouridine(1911/1915/1917) synthase [Weissella soli]NKY82550.1 RluA family pseudouridine synthase [Weissella soli]RDL11665.1 ribosomal large subunit pseudouridine synthase D [Weissella soli]GEN93108.1 pseudouridine synthase [Weissella soli]GJM48103.1 pseudouridine synthase [Weissella soli]